MTTNDQMTPDEARWLLDGTTPGPWLSDLDRNIDEPSGIYAVVAQDGGFSARLVADEISEEADTALITAAPTLAAMIAGMRPEYAVQVRRSGRWQYSRDEDDFRWQDLAVQMVRADRDHPGEETRLVRRYVTEPEEP